MNKPIRSLFISTLLVALGLTLAACKHENTIVGKWKTSQGGSDSMVTFTADGKVLDDEGGKAQNGAYTLSASNTVTMTIPNPANPGGKDSMSIEFAIVFASPDEMTLTPKSMGGMPVPGGAAPAAKFTRVSK